MNCRGSQSFYPFVVLVKRAGLKHLLFFGSIVFCFRFFRRHKAHGRSNDLIRSTVPSIALPYARAPVVGSGLKRPSTSTLLPLCRYWLQTSACLPHTEMRNQMVSLTVCPAALVYWRLQASGKLVTGLSITRITHFGVAPQVASGNHRMKHGNLLQVT
jgi:hypothetical protein